VRAGGPRPGLRRQRPPSAKVGDHTRPPAPARVAAGGQHMGDLLGLQPAAQLGVLAGRLITAPTRTASSPREPAELQRQRRLRRERDVLADPRGLADVLLWLLQ
jgi:hypothetical protein